MRAGRKRPLYCLSSLSNTQFNKLDNYSLNLIFASHSNNNAHF